MMTCGIKRIFWKTLLVVRPEGIFYPVFVSRVHKWRNGG